MNSGVEIGFEPTECLSLLSLVCFESARAQGTDPPFARNERGNAAHHVKAESDYRSPQKANGESLAENRPCDNIGAR